MSASFPEPEWFRALGRLMEAEGERFRRIGYAETRFVINVLPDEGGPARAVGLVFDGYRLADAIALDDPWAFEPDFIVNAKRSVWEKMLREIAAEGHPQLRSTLNSLALMGEQVWLESSDQLREDKFYRYNQTIQEFFNLAQRL
ncbi:MAG TPA: hypothetical protein VLL57_08290 [Candidatus Binataceae bacterium]|nr:hypothetical protein [Candidatus Binataceae bacterium]